MPEALAILPLLLLPVVALLFLSLRLSRRLRYPHDLLLADARRGAASLLPRWLRTHHDALFDAAIALALAFALSPAAAGPAAAVIDCSRSMLAGSPGSRPLDLALKRFRSDPALRAARPFALAFDPARMRSRIAPVSGLREARTPEAAARILEDGFAFFAVDYAELASLRRGGFGPLTLLTDSLGARAEGFEALESGFAVGYAAWPCSARADGATGTWAVVLAESGPRGAVAVWLWDRAEGRFMPLKSSRYAIEERAGGRTVRLAEPGLYRITLRAPPGDLDVDIPVLLRPPALPAAAEGPFSERMIRAFGFIEGSGSPSLALVDAPPRTGAMTLGPAASRAIAGTSDPALSRAAGTSDPALPPNARANARAIERAPRRIATALLAADGPFVLDPALSLGRPIAAGLSAGADFALGPSSLANDDLVLAYDAAIAATAPRPFHTRAPAGTRELVESGGAYLAKTASGLEPLIPPASEFFAPAKEGVVRLPPRSPGRWTWALILAGLSAAKLFAWAKLGGKGPFREDGSRREGGRLPKRPREATVE